MGKQFLQEYQQSTIGGIQRTMHDAQCTMHSAQCTNRHENNSKTRNQTHEKGSCSLRMGKGDKGQLPPGRNEQNNKTVISSLLRGIYGI